MTKYTFRTIVAPDAVRADFTVLRDQLNSSDKELMQAFWNLGIDRLDDIKREVEMLQAEAAQARAEKQEIKAAAKLKEKAAIAEKKKAPKTEEFVDDGDGIETVVVDGTR
jgi:peptidoglycan hydrolase CwlO-like protein